MGASISPGAAGGAPKGATRTALSLSAVMLTDGSPERITKSEEGILVQLAQAARRHRCARTAS
jgi:hypothetical protein